VTEARWSIVAALLAAACGSAPPATTTPARSIEPPTVRGAELVHFPSNDADLTHAAPTMLDGWLFRPTGTGPFPAVVALHGCAGLYAGTDLTARHRDWAERLTGQGYVVLLPDSFSPRGYDEICSRDQRTIRPGYERDRDTYGALRFLEAQPFVRPDDVGLLGWSNGGITVLMTVSSHTRSRPRDLPHDFRVAVAFYPSCRTALERDDWMPPVAPLHVLIGESDDWTPAPPCVELGARAKAVNAPVEVVVYPGAYHDFDDPVMPVHTRGNVATTPSGRATIGSNPAARADAIARVTGIFRDALAPTP
jgi:dienelactone hydrolase